MCGDPFKGTCTTQQEPGQLYEPDSELGERDSDAGSRERLGAIRGPSNNVATYDSRNMRAAES